MLEQFNELNSNYINASHIHVSESERSNINYFDEGLEFLNQGGFLFKF